MKGVKKLVNVKIFVLITCRIESIEWLGIDSSMMKLIEKIVNLFLGVITQCLSPQLKIGTFPHNYVGQNVDFRRRSLIVYTVDDAAHIN